MSKNPPENTDTKKAALPLESWTNLQPSERDWSEYLVPDNPAIQTPKGFLAKLRARFVCADCDRLCWQTICAGCTRLGPTRRVKTDNHDFPRPSQGMLAELPRGPKRGY